MEIFRLSIYLLIIIFIGFNILYLLSPKRNKLYFLEKIAISYGIGFGFVSLEMLIFHFFKLEFNINEIILPWTILFILSAFVYFKNRKNIIVHEKIEADTKAHRGLKIFLIAAITFEILYAFFRALVKPLEAYDAIAIYGIKAKIFYLAKSIPYDFFRNLALSFPHADYPLNIPLSETFVYLFLGNLNDQLVKVIFPLYFVATLIILYFGIRRFASQTCALFFTFLLASIPQFSAFATNGYLDLQLGYYYSTSALFLFLWFKSTEDHQFLLISAVMVALAGWTKNEGLMYCLVNIGLISIFYAVDREMPIKKKLFHLFSYISIIAIISLPWLWIKGSVHLANDEVQFANLNISYLSKQYYKIVPIIYEFQKQTFGPKKWNILWLIMIFVLGFKYKDMFKKNQRYISIAMSLTILGYVLSYIISRSEIHYALGATWSRFLLHFLPIVMYWLANIVKEDIEP